MASVSSLLKAARSSPTGNEPRYPPPGSPGVCPPRSHDERGRLPRGRPVRLGSAWRQDGTFTGRPSLVSLGRVVGYGAAEALGTHSRAIEATRASFSFGEHVAGSSDPTHARLCLLGGDD